MESGTSKGDLSTLCPISPHKPYSQSDRLGPKGIFNDEKNYYRLLNEVLSVRAPSKTSYSDANPVQCNLNIIIQVEVLWVETPCNDVVGYQRFGGQCCVHLHFTFKEAAWSSETLVSYHIMASLF